MSKTEPNRARARIASRSRSTTCPGLCSMRQTSCWEAATSRSTDLNGTIRQGEKACAGFLPTGSLFNARESLSLHAVFSRRDRGDARERRPRRLQVDRVLRYEGRAGRGRSRRKEQRAQKRRLRDLAVLLHPALPDQVGEPGGDAARSRTGRAVRAARSLEEAVPRRGGAGGREGVGKAAAGVRRRRRGLLDGQPDGRRALRPEGQQLSPDQHRRRRGCVGQDPEIERARPEGVEATVKFLLTARIMS